MAAAPQFGTLYVSIPGSGVIPLDMYLSDVANSLVNFDTQSIGAGSGTGTELHLPKGARLVDMDFNTGLTDTKLLKLLINDEAKRSAFRYAGRLNTNSGRAGVNVPVGGVKVELKQLV